MVYFQTKNPNLGKFLRALERKMFVYFMVIWDILWPFSIFYGNLVYFPPFKYMNCVKKNLTTLVKFGMGYILGDFSQNRLVTQHERKYKNG
jgi:hypothetical protein